MLGRKLGKRQQHGIRIDHRITQEELSGMVGTTRSRVGLFLKRFCDAGLVQRSSGSQLVIDDRSLSEYLETGA
jgi:CRP/FNR family cyclic AMP-dependent transcriptional regulator